MYTCIHIYIYAYIHTYIPKYIHTYIHTYIYMEREIYTHLCSAARDILSRGGPRPTMLHYSILIRSCHMNEFVCFLLPTWQFSVLFVNPKTMQNTTEKRKLHLACLPQC